MVRLAASWLRVGVGSTAPFVIAVCAAPAVQAQSDEEPNRDSNGHIEVPIDTAVTTEHTVTINGQVVPYRATAGTLPVYNSENEATASLFYVYYERTDVQDREQRPLTISFNGGPGSASVWMHIGYTGPRNLIIDDEGFPVQPYGYRENPYSILDVTDIVYVNPVNTAYSRPLDGVDPDQFFGVNEDIAYLADWIRLFVTRQGRWASPKFLIGESYGTTRVSGLARRLQGSNWMYLNGVILVSPTSLGIDRDGPVGDALILPHYTATAWYHQQLEPSLQGRELDDLLAEVETFTVDEYLPALVRGGFLDDSRRDEIATRVAQYAGVSQQFVLNNNLTIPIGHWRKELMRDARLTVGRLDARYRGVDRDAAGTSYDYDPALTAWNHAFSPAINQYVREELGYQTDLRYNLFGPVNPWNRQGDETGENLRQAMAENPFLKVMIQSGYYDGGTDYFSAKYTMWQMDPSGQLRDRFRFETYRSGHMMYLRQEDLPTSNEHIREFIQWATVTEGTPAIY